MKIYGQNFSMTSYKPYHETFIFFNPAWQCFRKVPVKDSVLFATLFSKSLEYLH